MLLSGQCTRGTGVVTQMGEPQLAALLKDVRDELLDPESPLGPPRRAYDRPDDSDSAWSAAKQGHLQQILTCTPARCSAPDVSEVASKLQADGLIRYSRGDLTITDRPGLE
jgi:hypothetical protein